jgi:hypothetical protein
MKRGVNPIKRQRRFAPNNLWAILWIFLLAFMLQFNAPAYAQHTLVELENAATVLHGTDSEAIATTLEFYRTRQSIELLLNYCDQSSNQFGNNAEIAFFTIAMGHLNPAAKFEAARLWLKLKIAQAKMVASKAPLEQRGRLLKAIRSSSETFVDQLRGKKLEPGSDTREFQRAVEELFHQANAIIIGRRSDYFGAEVAEKIDFSRPADLRYFKFPSSSERAIRDGLELLQGILVILDEIGRQPDGATTHLQTIRSLRAEHPEYFHQRFMRQAIPLMMVADFAPQVWGWVDHWIISGRYTLHEVLNAFELESPQLRGTNQLRAQMVVEVLKVLNMRGVTDGRSYSKALEPNIVTLDPLAYLRSSLFSDSTMASIELQRDLIRLLHQQLPIETRGELSEAAGDDINGIQPINFPLLPEVAAHKRANFGIETVDLLIFTQEAIEVLQQRGLSEGDFLFPMEGRAGLYQAKPLRVLELLNHIARGKIP